MRRYDVDNIRWMTVVLVVLYHVIYMYNGIVTAGVVGSFREIQYQDAFQYVLYPWFMLIHRFEAGKLYRLCGRVSPLMLVALGVSVWASAQILNTPVIVVYRFGIYGFCFLLGYFVFAQEAVVERLSRYWHVLAIAVAVLCFGYVYFYFGENYAQAPLVNSPFSVAYGWMAILAIFAGMRRWGNRTNAFADWMRKKSFGLYVFHYLPLAAFAYWMNRYTNLPALPSYLISGTAAFAGGFLLYEVVVRIPLLRWCVLGVGKEKNLGSGSK